MASPTLGMRGTDHGSQATPRDVAAGDLGLRADQKDDVHTLKSLRVEEIAKHVTSGDRFEKIKSFRGEIAVIELLA